MPYRKRESSGGCIPHDYEIVNVSRGSGCYSPSRDSDGSIVDDYAPTVIITKRCRKCGNTITEEEPGSPSDYRRY